MCVHTIVAIYIFQFGRELSERVIEFGSWADKYLHYALKKSLEMSAIKDGKVGPSHNGFCLFVNGIRWIFFFLLSLE